MCIHHRLLNISDTVTICIYHWWLDIYRFDTVTICIYITAYLMYLIQSQNVHKVYFSFTFTVHRYAFLSYKFVSLDIFLDIFLISYIILTGNCIE